MIKKLFAVLIICSLSLPVLAIEEQEAEVAQENQATETIIPNDADEINNIQLRQDTVSAQTQIPTTYKKPVSKKKLAMKFIIAMLCVAGTAVFLYITLSIYNKIRDNVNSNVTLSSSAEEKPLNSPSDLTDAIKTFIEKTKWED